MSTSRPSSDEARRLEVLRLYGVLETGEDQALNDLAAATGLTFPEAVPA